MLKISLLLFAAFASEPAASPAPAAKAEMAAPAKPAKPKKICVEEARLGSLMSHRICATQEEWDRRAERDAAEMAKSQNIPNNAAR